jgi:uncharacterized protein involved in exopolysaccharide biosynthesis/Mg-chelatase subunit ChlD
MTPDSPNPRSELEARLTALLLGELPADESATLRQAIAQDPELAKLYARLEQTIELVRETAATPADQSADQPSPLQLSEERREKLLARFKTVAPKEFQKPKKRKVSWALQMAAMAAVVAIIAAIAVPSMHGLRHSLGLFSLYTLSSEISDDDRGSVAATTDQSTARNASVEAVERAKMDSLSLARQATPPQTITVEPLEADKAVDFAHVAGKPTAKLESETRDREKLRGDTLADETRGKAIANNIVLPSSTELAAASPTPTTAPERHGFSLLGPMPNSGQNANSPSVNAWYDSAEGNRGGAATTPATQSEARKNPTGAFPEIADRNGFGLKPSLPPANPAVPPAPALLAQSELAKELPAKPAEIAANKRGAETDQKARMFYRVAPGGGGFGGGGGGGGGGGAPASGPSPAANTPIALPTPAGDYFFTTGTTREDVAALGLNFEPGHPATTFQIVEQEKLAESDKNGLSWGSYDGSTRARQMAAVESATAGFPVSASPSPPIDPSTGLPAGTTLSGPPPTIDPATGLPLPLATPAPQPEVAIRAKFADVAQADQKQKATDLDLYDSLGRKPSLSPQSADGHGQNAAGFTFGAAAPAGPAFDAEVKAGVASAPTTIAGGLGGQAAGGGVRASGGRSPIRAKAAVDTPPAVVPPAPGAGFLSYDDPGKVVPRAQAAANGSVGIPMAVYGEPGTDSKDKVPFLGDLPMAGRLFRSEGKASGGASVAGKPVIDGDSDVKLQLADGLNQNLALNMPVAGTLVLNGANDFSGGKAIVNSYVNDGTITTAGGEGSKLSTLGANQPEPALKYMSQTNWEEATRGLSREERDVIREKLDQPTKQVLIESRLLETDANKAPNRGIYWGPVTNYYLPSAQAVSGGRVDKSTKIYTGPADVGDITFSIDQDSHKIVIAGDEDTRKAVGQVLAEKKEQPAPQTSLTAETLRHIEGTRIESKSDLVRRESMVNVLRKAQKEQGNETLAQVLQSASPDAQLGSLLEQQNTAKQRLAMVEKELGANNPEVAKAKGQVEVIRKRVDSRAGEVMKEMDTKVASLKDGVAKLDKEVSELTAKDTAASEATRPYWEAKRELEELQSFQKILNMKIASENVDVTLPKSAMVEIVDNAKTPPPKAPSLWERLGGAKAGEVASTARVKVERDQNEIQGMASPKTMKGYDPYFIQTEFEVLQSDAVLGKVVNDLKLDEAWARKGASEGKLKHEEAITQLKKKLDLHPIKGTGLIEIKAKSDKPEEAAQIANAVAKEYQDLRQNQWNQRTLQGVRVLEGSFQEQEQKIREAKEKVEKLRKELGIADATAAPTATPSTSSPQKEPEPPKQSRPKAPAAEPQPEVQTCDNAFSTFSLNISDVSFKLALASLEKGQIPDAASVRSEEFINAFDYRDPDPPPGAPIGYAFERARYPFAQNRDLIRFSLKTAALGRQAGRPLNLVLLLDNSGSMERADRVQIIHEALRVLAGQLQPKDKLSVITFARTARLIADGVAGNEAGRIVEEVSGLTPQGGTNLEEAMNTAYATALRHYLADGINRVVLLTDGAANLGDVEPEALKQKVEAHRKQGVALDCFGIGWEGYNDDLLEVLSRNGDGRYGFINSPEEAATEFAGQLAGALHVAASDVKVQVEFNPKRVVAYRQIGYAKHKLTKEQFRDNTVDAAEIAAKEAGNALYVVEVNPRGEGPIGTVRVRYKVPGTSEYHEHEWEAPYAGSAVDLAEASPAMRLAASASAFSEWLVSSPFASEVTSDSLLGYLSGVPEVYGADGRPKKLEWAIRQAKSLVGK